MYVRTCRLEVKAVDCLSLARTYAVVQLHVQFKVQYASYKCPYLMVLLLSGSTVVLSI